MEAEHRPSASHADLLAAVDAELRRSNELAAEHTNDWTRQETLMSLHQRRARLVGGFDDLIAADEASLRAFQIAPAGGGPWHSKAKLDFALHRLDRVEASLAKVEGAVIVDDPTRADVARMRGDVALQRGDHAGARAAYAQAEAIKATLATCYGAVQLDWWEARFDAAQEGLDRCEKTYVVTDDPQTRAWFDLQRGLVDLDRGRWEDAERHYVDASHEVEGWFLVDEHLAEVRLLLGRTEESEAAYRDIIARTDGAEFMDALAGLLIASGRADGADGGREWAAKAEAKWRATLARLPEAAGGHALDHFLEFGTDPQETLAFARANATLRPNGAARVQLARALIGAGDDAAATAEIEAVLATPYRSAALFEVASTLAHRRGDEAAAAEALKQAQAIDPHATAS